MTFSSRMQTVASDLLTEYGQSVSVVRDNIGSYNSSDGTVSDSADTTYSGYGHPRPFNKFQVDGVNILSTDIRLMFYSTTAPQINDIFTLNSVAYTAININTLNAQGDDVYYEVQLRK